MSALDKLRSLMSGLKTIEHDRWDTAAHAVLELERKFGLGAREIAPDPVPVATAPDPQAAADIAALKGEVALLTDQVKVLGEAVDMLLKAPAADAPVVPVTEAQPA